MYLVGSDMVRQIQKASVDMSPGEALLQCDFHIHWALSTPPPLAAENFESVSGESKAGAGP